MLTKNIFRILLLALCLLSLPASAKRHKVSAEERTAAIMRTYDLLQSGQWVMMIDDITTPKVSFTHLISERNYLYIEDSYLVVQTDITGAHSANNLNALERKEAARSAAAHLDYVASFRPGVCQKFKIASSDIRTNRKGTKVILNLYIDRPHYTKKLFERIVIDPITMKASNGTLSGHIVPDNETLLIMRNPK